MAGSWATALFAVGFIATGVLAVPVLAGAGSVALASLLGQPWGLNRSPRKAPLFYGLVAVATLGGVVASAVSSDPVGLLVLSAVINGVAAAPFVVVVTLVSRDRDLMGDQANGRLSSFVGWLTAAIMGVAGIVGLYVVIAHPV